MGGRTGVEFFVQLSYKMTVLGLDEPSACICAGSHAADPHYTERGCIERGNCLLMDFGGTYQGYYTDMTQTFWFDDPDPEFVPDSCSKGGRRPGKSVAGRRH